MNNNTKNNKNFVFSLKVTDILSDGYTNAASVLKHLIGHRGRSMCWLNFTTGSIN